MKKTSTQSSILIENEQAMLDLGAKLSQQIDKSAIVFLQGPLGAGKTTLVRGFLRALGYSGTVKSPTYTLVESYPFDHRLTIHHFDLYRLKSPFELDDLGPDHYFTSNAICFIEWPEKAEKILPQPTLWLSFIIQGDQRLISYKKTSPNRIC